MCQRLSPFSGMPSNGASGCSAALPVRSPTRSWTPSVSDEDGFSESPNWSNRNPGVRTIASKDHRLDLLAVKARLEIQNSGKVIKSHPLRQANHGHKPEFAVDKRLEPELAPPWRAQAPASAAGFVRTGPGRAGRQRRLRGKRQAIAPGFPGRLLLRGSQVRPSGLAAASVPARALAPVDARRKPARLRALNQPSPAMAGKVSRALASPAAGRAAPRTRSQAAQAVIPREPAARGAWPRCSRSAAATSPFATPAESRRAPRSALWAASSCAPGLGSGARRDAAIGQRICRSPRPGVRRSSC